MALLLKSKQKSSGTPVQTQTKTATPYTTEQTIVPDTGYLLSEVTVEAIAFSTEVNSAGGLTATIGTVAPSA